MHCSMALPTTLRYRTECVLACLVHVWYPYSDCTIHSLHPLHQCFGRRCHKGVQILVALLLTTSYAVAIVLLSCVYCEDNVLRLDTRPASSTTGGCRCLLQ
ncbi:hypothetical protein LZ31DRAFT_292390 [Colletotrichum somersetense]|nr:hypothetical protein LZ31DRAFT_292390 [Colletotrichum somersetense]